MAGLEYSKAPLMAGMALLIHVHCAPVVTLACYVYSSSRQVSGFAALLLAGTILYICTCTLCTNSKLSLLCVLL
jgi:hypothetical protein